MSDFSQQYSPLGFLPQGWTVKKLKKLCLKIGSGATPRGGKDVYLSERESHALIRSQHVYDHHFDETRLAFISEEHAEELKNVEVQSKDILFNITGDGITFARACIVPESILPAAVNQHVAIIRTSNSLIPHFLLGYLTLPQIKIYMESFNSGGSRRALTKGNIESFEIPVPPLEEQKAIAAVLSCLDAKIENLRKQNETLEAIAQTLFKHWFIDFEFPDPDGKPYKSSGGAMEPSELGEIPTGWHVESLDSIADFLNGLALQKYPAENDNDFLPVIKIRELKAGVTDNTDKATKKLPEKYIIDNGDVIFSWSGTLDVVIWCLGKGALNQHLFKVTSEKYPKYFYYQWVLFHLKNFQAIAKSKATTMGHIQRKHLTEALCSVPKKEQLNTFDGVLKPVLEKTIRNSLQIQTLTKTRDTLLPKLMSGQLRVKDL